MLGRLIDTNEVPTQGLLADRAIPGGTHEGRLDLRRVGATAIISLTGLVLLIPNLAPLLARGTPPLGIALSVLGSAVALGLVAAGTVLYWSDFTSANAVRIAAWNLLGVVVLGVVMVVHLLYQGAVGGGFGGAAFTAANVVTVGAAAHVVIGFYDARRVRAEQLARERQKLAVLTRVLRHNLRNEATVLIGRAEQLAAEIDDPDLAASAETVRTKAEIVGGLAEETKQIMTAVERRSEPCEPIHVSGIVETVAAEARRENPHAEVVTRIEGDPWIWADQGYRTALEHLVTNAIEHTDRADPHVHIVVRVRDDDRVETRVVDDGPGIPEHERAVVTGQQEITQLTHGSGLGLWVVRAAVDACGGKLEFGDRNDSGAIVTLDYHHCQPKAAP